MPLASPWSAAATPNSLAHTQTDRPRWYARHLAATACVSALGVLVLVVAGADARRGENSEFQVHTTEGEGAVGPLERITGDWSVTLGGVRPGQISGAALVALKRVHQPLPPPPAGEHLRLGNGDLIGGTPLELVGERLKWQVSSTWSPPIQGKPTEWELPLNAISLIWFAAPDSVDDPERFARTLTAERRRHDVIYLRNGDRLEGSLTSLTPAQIEFDGPKKKRLSFPRTKVALIAFNTELARRLRVQGPFGRLILRDGSRLTLVSASANEREMTGKTPLGANISVLVDHLACLTVHQGAAVYLSDLKPARYRYTSYLGVQWPFAVDSTVDGHLLRLAGSTYDKGIGLHSESRLTYSLDPGFRWFEAEVGLDDRAGSRGSASIEILLDGRLVPSTSHELSATSPPIKVRVSVEGAREITLVVKFGRFGDVQDHVDWANARLIR